MERRGGEGTEDEKPLRRFHSINPDSSFSSTSLHPLCACSFSPPAQPRQPHYITFAFTSLQIIPLCFPTTTKAISTGATSATPEHKLVLAKKIFKHTLFISLCLPKRFHCKQGDGDGEITEEEPSEALMCSLLERGHGELSQW